MNINEKELVATERIKTEGVTTINKLVENAIDRELLFFDMIREDIQAIGINLNIMKHEDKTFDIYSEKTVEYIEETVELLNRIKKDINSIIKIKG